MRRDIGKGKTHNTELKQRRKNAGTLQIVRRYSVCSWVDIKAWQSFIVKCNATTVSGDVTVYCLLYIFLIVGISRHSMCMCVRVRVSECVFTMFSSTLFVSLSLCSLSSARPNLIGAVIFPYQQRKNKYYYKIISQYDARKCEKLIHKKFQI